LYTVTNVLKGQKAIFSPISNVRYVEYGYYSTSWTGSLYFNEFDVYGAPNIAHDDVSYTSIVQNSPASNTISWVSPSNLTNVTNFKIYRDGTLIASPSKTDSSFTDTGLSAGTTYSYKVSILYSDSFETTGLTKSVTTLSPHDEISNLNATVTDHSANLVWSIPDNANLVGFNIYRDNKLIKTLNTIENYYLDDGLDELTSYIYKVTALYKDGYETSGIKKSFTTSANPVVKNVSNASATAVSYKQINISWALPDQKSFQQVNIYRAVKLKDQSVVGSILGTTVYADTAPQEIFQTNGTYFNDLTVQPDTNYEYTLQTETTDGRVSDG
jgi:hypothetical protein